MGILVLPPSWESKQRICVGHIKQSPGAVTAVTSLGCSERIQEKRFWRGKNNALSERFDAFRALCKFSAVHAYICIYAFMHRQGPLFFELYLSLSLLVFSFAPASVFPCRGQVSELDT